MSNFRAIATVTATLQRVLQAAVQADIPGATVSTVRPAEGQSTNLPSTGVNIFLYQVTTNPNWRNADLPTRRPNGETAQRPQAALDLHYLFSFYGDDLALEPQRLMGSSIAFLHSQPILTRADIQAAVADNTKPFLSNSDLADQIDKVRLVPHTMSLEELSRLWSVFFQVHYVLSISYQASVVLIEPQINPRPALPTRTLNLTAVPLRHPYISRIVADMGEGEHVTPGSAISIEGLGLQEAVTRVEIDGAPVPVTEVRANQISLVLPPELAAGPHGIQVRHGVEIGAAGVPHMASSSNLGSFVIQPVITQTGGNYDITISNVQGSGPTPRSATVIIGIAPAVQPRQTATLELLTSAGVAHTFMATPRTDDTTQLSCAISNVAAGVYLFRIRVDGAESTLELDSNRMPIAPQGAIP